MRVVQTAKNMTTEKKIEKLIQKNSLNKFENIGTVFSNR